MKRRTKADLLQEIERLQRGIAEPEAQDGAPDIAERKRAEEALRESEAKHRNLIENASIGIFRTKLDGSRVLDANPKLCEILGLTHEEFVDQPSAIAWAHPERREEMVRLLREKGNVSNYEIEIRTKAGEIRTVLMSMTTYPELGYIEGGLQDISEHKRAEKELQAANQQLAASNQQLRATEQQLRASNQQLRAMEQQLRASNQQLESGLERLADAQAIARLGSWEFDAVKDVITGSDEFYRLFGVSHDHLRTYQAFLDLLHPDDREHVGRDVQESLKKKALYDTEYRVRMPDGDYRYIHARGQIFADDAGKPVRMVGTCLDVTERKRMEEALRESEGKFRDVVRYLDEGYYSCATDGRLLDHNRAFNRILGFDLDQDLKGSRLPDFWQNPDERKEYLAELMSRGFIRNFPIKAKTIRGDKLIVIANSHLVKDEKGAPVRIEGTFTDFTERTEIEAALRASEAKYRALFEHAEIGMYRTKLDGSAFLDVNRKFAEILGCLPGDLVGTPGRIRWADADERARMLRALEARGGTLNDYETRVLAMTGDVRDVLASIVLHPEEDYLDGTMVDITDRKRAEEALREANDNLEQRVLERTKELAGSHRLLDETGKLARIGGWEIDLKNNKLSWTDMVKQIHEVGTEYQPTVEGAIDFYAPEAVPVISEALRRAIEDGQSFDVELPLITAKKNRVWVRAIGQAYRDGGEIVMVGGVFQDITARKLAEMERDKKSEQLQLLSTELEIIIDNIPGLVFYKDKNNRLIRVNKYMSDAYHLSKKQLEGINLNELHSREQAQAYYEDDLQVIRSRRPKLNIDEPWETETGTRWVSTSKIPYIDGTGEVVGIIGVSMDVTERKLAEEELKKHHEHLEELVKERTEKLAIAAENLERSNKELEQFAYVASHDLQEPLRMVSSYTQLFAQRYKDQLDDKAEKYIDYVVDGAVRMQRLINDLLTYSRVGTRGKPLEPTDSHSVLGEVLRNLQIAIDESRAIITNDDLPTLRADASQLLQVFQNLIANAIKFRRESPPRIHVSARDRGREWVFSISDNGIGIEPQYKDRIFVIFQRLHTKQEYPGTGIGLPLCKRIVERHGGKIWFESEPGKGTTFFFTILK